MQQLGNTLNEIGKAIMLVSYLMIAIPVLAIAGIMLYAVVSATV